MELGPEAWKETRHILQALITRTDIEEELFSTIFVPIGDLEMELPANIGDYTDFYSSKEHASNVGRMFRGEDNALMPNWCDYQAVMR
jgi:fumarylacetoacetase